MTLMFAAILAASLYAIGVAVIKICDTNDRINHDIEALILSKQMTDDLNTAAEQAGWK